MYLPKSVLKFIIIIYAISKKDHIIKYTEISVQAMGIWIMFCTCKLTLNFKPVIPLSFKREYYLGSGNFIEALHEHVLISIIYLLI